MSGGLNNNLLKQSFFFFVCNETVKTDFGGSDRGRSHLSPYNLNESAETKERWTGSDELNLSDILTWFTPLFYTNKIKKSAMVFGLGEKKKNNLENLCLREWTSRRRSCWISPWHLRRVNYSGTCQKVRATVASDWPCIINGRPTPLRPYARWSVQCRRLIDDYSSLCLNIWLIHGEVSDMLDRSCSRGAFH